MAYQPPLPNSSRLIDWGHSWVAPPPYPYPVSNSYSNVWQTYPLDGEQWSLALRDALGIGSIGYTKTYTIPSTIATKDLTTLLDFMPSDGTIDSVWWVPAVTVTGAATNNRTFSIQLTNSLNTTTILCGLTAVSGTSYPANVPVVLFNMNGSNGPSNGAAASAAAATVAVAGTPYAAGLQGLGGSAGVNPASIQWASTHNGTGVVDPGGTILIRFGTRYRNYGAGGASLLGYNQIAGSWWAPFSWSPWSRPNAPRFNVSTALPAVGPASTTSAAGATTVTAINTATTLALTSVTGWPNSSNTGIVTTSNGTQAFTYTGVSGSNLTGVVIAGSAGSVAALATIVLTQTLTFSGLDTPMLYVSGSIVFSGGSATVNVVGGALAVLFGVGVNATSLVINAPGFAVAAGSQGILGGIGGTGHETQSPTGINCWTHGLNDSNQFTQDRPAWRETVRACIARNCCSTMEYPTVNASSAGNFVSANGTGGGAWSNILPPVNGWLPYITDTQTSGTGNLKMWAGAVATSPTMTIGTGVAFEGGVLDVFLLSVAGTGQGIAGTITVDGATPPQGAVTFNTGSVSATTANTRLDTGTIATSGSSVTVIGTGTSFGANDVGRMLTAIGGTITSLPAGTYITAVASATSITVSQAINVSGTTPTTRGYTPMVKRLTGLSSGAHTVTLTLTGNDSASSAMILYGLGIETLTPQTPVLWCNIALSPGQSGGQQTNATNLNTDSAAVIVGTAAAITGNTTEPALGANVQFVDINSVMGAATKYFLTDGIHPNSAGHRVIARTLFSVIRNSFSPDQLMAR